MPIRIVRPLTHSIRSIGSWTAMVLLVLTHASAQDEPIEQPSLSRMRSHASARERKAPTPLLEQSDWFQQVSAQLECAEYRYSPVPGDSTAWSAPNRGHGFVSRVSAAGIEVHSRTASRASADRQWQLVLGTKRFGRTDHAAQLSAATVRATTERIELDHGPLTEWFVNDERGLEQGWTIASAPRGAGRLWIGLEIGGDLCLRIDEGARSGVFVDAVGETRLRYTGLTVLDATGRELEARLAASANGVGISIDDTHAAYPLTVDPLLTGPAWSVESDQEYGTMGHAVASAGDVDGDGYSDVLVGALAYSNGQSQEGRAFLYLGSSAGLSSNAAWTAEGNQPAAFFGASLGTAGDVNGDGYSDVIVGSWSYDNQGAAFVYLGSSAGLSATPVATLEGGQANAVFGASVGTAGDVNGDGYSDVIVGAKYFSNGQSNEGKAFVFLGSSGGVNTSAAWTAELDQANAYFGQAVGAAGDVNGDGYDDVLVGAPSYSTTVSSVGRAFLYLGSSSGIAATPAWSLTGSQRDEWLGYSLSTAGDVNGDGYSDVIVGAPAYDNGELTEGAAFLFLGSASGLASLAAWSAESDRDSAFFGGSVGTAGDVNGDGYSDVIVGAESYPDGQVVGRASVYLGSSGVLATSAAWTAQGDQADALFGGAVATAGDVNGDGFSDAIIGARAYSNGQWSEGRAFVYRGASAGLATSSAWSGEGWQEFVGYGWSVACAGDVNGDGFSDVVVGAPTASDDQAFEGMAFLYLGSATGLSRTPSWQTAGDQVDSWFGYPVGTAGDVNGDGYGDVIVAAHRFDNGQTDEGRVFVYLGSSSGLSPTPAWTAECDQAGANFGYCAASAGDVNGDGFGDVIVGAANHDNAALNMGKAFVYLGSGTGLSAAPDWSFEGNQANAFLGASVATAGDVNADGYSDVVVGASGANGGLFGTGTALVFLGSSSGLGAFASWSADGSSPVGRFGYSVATAGDVNADGYSDVIIGAPGVNHAFDPVTNGEAFVYLGSSSGLSQSPVASLAGAILSAFGYFVATAADVNADGYSDVIVGAPTAWVQSVNDGYASLFLGSASGVSSASAWTVVGAGQSALLGAGLASAGDVNGDGHADVIVGELGYAEDAGRALLFLGNEGRGSWTLAPQQHLADDSAPIDLLGASIDNQAFGIRLGLQHSLAGFAWATGRSSNVRLEWEVKPLDHALDGTSTQTSPPSVVTGLPLFFDELARFHPGGGPQQRIALGPYHWRARLRTENPLFPATRWVTIPWNNVTETKLTVPVNLPFSYEPH